MGSAKAQCLGCVIRTWLPATCNTLLSIGPLNSNHQSFKFRFTIPSSEVCFCVCAEIFRAAAAPRPDECENEKNKIVYGWDVGLEDEE